MNNKKNIKNKKNFGFLILIISGVIGIGFLLGMLSPFYNAPESWDYEEEFNADETLTINGSFEDENGEMHEINFDPNNIISDENSILFVYKNGRNAEFKTTNEFVTDLFDGNIESYLFAVPKISITVDLDKDKQKIEIKDYEMNIVDINEADELYNEENVIFSDWNNVYNNKIDESDGFEQRWATQTVITIDKDNKVIDIDNINRIDEEFTLASETDGDYGTISFITDWSY